MSPPRGLLGACLRSLADRLRRKAGIENRRHWTLDVAFGEDYCRVWTLHAAENRTTVLRIAMNLLNRYGRRHGCGPTEARMLANQLPEVLEPSS